MKFTRLGRTALKVSRLCLGTMNFGPHTSESDSFAIMDKALELGINFFDTANVYGWKKGEGITEQIIGRWLAQGGGRREKVVLATKVYGAMGDWPNESRLSALHIRRACEESLRRMKTDHIDLYQMHHVDRDAPWEEIWQAMETLVQQGKVIYVGSSNFAGWHIARANEAAKARHFLGLVSEQSLYNLIDRTLELEVIPACAAYGLGVIPWSPLKGGVLGGNHRDKEAGARRRDAAARHPKARGKARPIRCILQGIRKAAGGCRARVGAGEPGRHRADRRPAHDEPPRRRARRARSEARRNRDEEARRNFPRPRRPRARSLRLVIRARITRAMRPRPPF